MPPPAKPTTPLLPAPPQAIAKPPAGKALVLRGVIKSARCGGYKRVELEDSEAVLLEAYWAD